MAVDKNMTAVRADPAPLIGKDGAGAVFFAGKAMGKVKAVIPLNDIRLDITAGDERADGVRVRAYGRA